MYNMFEILTSRELMTSLVLNNWAQKVFITILKIKVKYFI